MTVTQNDCQNEAFADANHELVAARDTLEDDSIAATAEISANLVAECRAQLEIIARENYDLTAERDALAIDVATLTSARDEQAKLVDELIQKLSQIRLECEKAQLSAAENIELFNESQVRIKTLESENYEFKHRQRILREELVRAEAQIDLIQELLLREPGL